MQILRFKARLNFSLLIILNEFKNLTFKALRESTYFSTRQEVIVEPKYNYVTPFAGEKFVAMKRDENLSTIEILNKSGEKIVDFKIGSDQKYNNLNLGASTSNYLAVCSSVDGEEQWGYIDFSKNEI